MRLKIMLPAEIILDQEVQKITAEAENGSFTLLPRHIDFVAALVPGILSFTAANGHEEFVAINEGMLVKCGPEVLVSTRNAARGTDLGSLKQTVEERFRVLDERERLARTAAARLEADMVRRFLEMEEYG